MKRIAVLGSTGSIGTQSLSVAEFHRDKFEVTALAAGSNVALMSEQIEKFRPKYVGMFSEGSARILQDRFPHVEVVSGSEVNDLAALPQVDTVINGINGFAGLEPLIKALICGKTVALANKESIVCGHAVIKDLLKKGSGRIIPVDSEQSAIFQCLSAGSRSDVSRLILTASGGMFRNLSKDELKLVTPAMALRHPTWSMGGKITIDSSTLFNKGLELMEAGWLFDETPDKISILVHPQSIVHSMVEFDDGSVFAQMSPPDMRLAIQYALTYPDRFPSQLPRLDLTKLSGLTFFEPDTDRFPAISLAYEAFREGNTLPIVYNAANEIAVDRFVKGDIPFTEIAECVAFSMEQCEINPVHTLDDIYQTDTMARRIASEYRSKTLV